MDAASHPFRCLSRIPDGPPDLFRCSFLTAYSISSSVDTESSTSTGFTATGMFSPRDGTYLYRSARSAVIRSSYARAGGGARLTAALYHPLSRLQASFGFDGSAPSNVSTSSPAISTLLFMSSLRLAAIARLSLLIFACTLFPRRAETLSSTIIHVSSDIH